MDFPFFDETFRNFGLNLGVRSPRALESSRESFRVSLIVSFRSIKMGNSCGKGYSRIINLEIEEPCPVGPSLSLDPDIPRT